MTTPKECPGFEQFKHLKSFLCKCPECGTEVEVFSDEFDKPKKCPNCGKQIDFTRCELQGGA